MPFKFGVLVSILTILIFLFLLMDLFLSGGDFGDTSVDNLLGNLGEMSVTGGNISRLQGDNGTAGGVVDEGSDIGDIGVVGQGESISAIEVLGLTLLASPFGSNVVGSGNLVGKGLYGDGGSVGISHESGSGSGKSGGVAVVSGVSEVSESISVSGVSVVSIGISFTFSEVMMGNRSSIACSSLSEGLEVVGLGGFYVGVEGSHGAIVVVHQGGGGMGREAHQNQRLHDGYCVIHKETHPTLGSR